MSAGKRKISNPDNDLIKTKIYLDKTDYGYIYNKPTDCKKIDGKDAHKFGENYIYIFTSNTEKGVDVDYYINTEENKIYKHEVHLHFKKSKKSVKPKKSIKRKH